MTPVKTTSSQLRKNMIAGSLYSGATTLLMAFSYPMYLRLLGYEQYGLWLVLSTVLSFAQLSNLGLGQAVSKQVAFSRSIGDDHAIDSNVSTALCTLLVSGGAVCLLIVALRHPIAASFRLSAINAELVSALLPAVGLLSLYAIFLDTLSSTLSGLGRIDLYNYLQLTGQAVSVVLTLILLRLGHGIGSFIIGNASAYMLVHVVTATLVKKQLGRSVLRLRNFSFVTLRDTLKMSLYLMGCSVMAIVLGPVNKFFLARYVGVSVLPTYDIIYNGSMKMRSLLETAIRGLMPEVSRLAAKSDIKGIQNLKTAISKKLLFGGGAMYAVLILTCGIAVKMWLGKLAVNFPVGSLRVALLGTYLSLLGVPAYYTLLGLGKSAKLFISNLIQSGVPMTLLVVVLLTRQEMSLFAVLASVAVGMVASTAYLSWQTAREMHTALAIQHVAVDMCDRPGLVLKA